MSYYSTTQDCGCYVSVDVDEVRCYCRPGDYCYCYDYSGGLQSVDITYCATHGGS